MTLPNQPKSMNTSTPKPDNITQKPGFAPFSHEDTPTMISNSAMEPTTGQ
jgi:hypothetical protein